MYVKIHDIVPYERNARHNASAVPVVADSIKEFGLRGTIGLESRERPVIVWGHTRVEACRSLGWDEIPDSKIEYCDDLTDEQIKAFRIADNKTGEVATWNKSMLREEVRSLKDFDMSRFGLDFKSKRLDYGHERLRTDDAYNLRLVSRSDCGRDGMPRMKRCMARPADMIGFNYAKSTPDFSLYLDMPDAMQRWNRYRSQALGHWWQEQGLRVVPTLSWAQRRSFCFAFDGVPRRSTVAVSTVGVKGDEGALAVWREGMAEAMSRLEPARVLLYGGDIGFDFGGCEVVEYKGGGFRGR